MNVNAFLQKDYENEPPSGPKKTNPIKPNSNPILEKMNVNFCITEYYESKPKALKKPPLLEVNSEPLRKDW
ncbi:MAG TPA: hypothetical protein VMW72_25460 [Sedimentisphaerales bacterium]|nr:hypothetical protein [Sedimentisphaerales bacterium]